MLYEPSPPTDERCRRATERCHHFDCVELKQEIRAAAFTKRLIRPLTCDKGFIQDSDTSPTLVNMWSLSLQFSKTIFILFRFRILSLRIATSLPSNFCQSLALIACKQVKWRQGGRSYWNVNNTPLINTDALRDKSSKWRVVAMCNRARKCAALCLTCRSL